MPIYSYECDKFKCRAAFKAWVEVIQSHSDAPPNCGCCGEPMKRKPSVSSFAFVTKGGNLFNFSGAHGRVTKGSRRISIIGRGQGMGGKKGRKNPTQADVISGAATSHKVNLS